MLQGLIIVLAAVIASTATLGQQGPKQARIGYVSPAAYSGTGDEYPMGLRKGLANRGYAEGHNLLIEVRYANGVADRLPSLISGLLTKRVDLLVASVRQFEDRWLDPLRGDRVVEIGAVELVNRSPTRPDV